MARGLFITMITLRNIHKSFGRQEVFSGGDLQINAGDRFALVGPNGAGKSTLMKILLGVEQADSGEVAIKRGTISGYLPQENAPFADKSVVATAVEEIDNADGRTTAKAKAILMGLGFTEADFERPVKDLSGGWAMRVAMARLLVKEPDLLLLDEPTNHLDLESLLWFQTYLESYPGSIFMISHDRAFINALCSAIVSVQDHTLKVYRGDYEDFVEEREREKEAVRKAYKEQQDEIADMKDFIARNRVRASTANRAQSMIKRLAKVELISLPPESRQVRISFPQPEKCGVRVMELKDVHKSYGTNKVYEGLDFELERGWKMAFVGHNGAGKSTLLKILAGDIEFDSGERKMAWGVKVGYFSQHREGHFAPGKTVLQDALSANRDVNEVDVRTILGTFLFPGDSVHKQCDVLSGGEKSRLALVKLLLDPPNVLLMDEPTTHLDMASVDALIAALKSFEGTLCTISHDVYFMQAMCDHVVHVDHGKVTVFPGDYEYFQRRQAQGAVGGTGQRGEEMVAAPKQSAKEFRENQKEDRAKQRKIQRLEVEVAAKHARLEKLATELSDPKVYEDFNRVTAIGDEMQALQDELATREAELERAGRE
jgi:ATP-binding cassette subfamily F protein 3